MADQGKSKTRKKKKNEESTADILAGLAKTLDQNAKKAKKKVTVMEFRRDLITGQRIYVSRITLDCVSTMPSNSMNGSCSEGLIQLTITNNESNHEFLKIPLNQSQQFVDPVGKSTNKSVQ
ncbi:hypothetical protein ACROYT_G031577 [Oculina patagonica]